MSSEFYHKKAVEIACLFLPGQCPILKHYITTYNKNYGNELPTISEDNTINKEIYITKANTYSQITDSVFIKYDKPKTNKEQEIESKFSKQEVIIEKTRNFSA